uniref:STAR protein homodimerisation region domain-containing protein n=1 Tax=Myripristis murdjan TaxID=586833 RepID=A0A667XEQ2_9TELE
IMVGEMEAKEKPRPSPDYLMQLMNDKKLMSSLPNFCGIFNHLERLLDEGETGCVTVTIKYHSVTSWHLSNVCVTLLFTI